MSDKERNRLTYTLEEIERERCVRVCVMWRGVLRAQRGRVVVRCRLTSCLCMWEGYEGWIIMN